MKVYLLLRSINENALQCKDFGMEILTLQGSLCTAAHYPPK